MNGITFKTISTRSELEEVGRLRYQTFVVERGCQLPEADHQHKTIIEELDEQIFSQGENAGGIIGAYEGEDLVGTARINLLGGPTAAYEEMYRCGEMNLRPSDRATITTRLCISAEKRHSALSVLLFKEAYQFAIKQGSKINFADCNTPLVKFFKRFGFQQTFSAFEHPAFGLIHPMVALLEDIPYFKKVGSPFLEFQHSISIDPVALSRLRLSLKRIQHIHSSRTHSPIYEHNR